MSNTRLGAKASSNFGEAQLKNSPTKVAQNRLKTTKLILFSGGNSSHMGEKAALTHPRRQPWVTHTAILKVCRRSLWLLFLWISQSYSLRAGSESWTLNIDYWSLVSLTNRLETYWWLRHAFAILDQFLVKYHWAKWNFLPSSRLFLFLCYYCSVYC